MVPLTVGSEPRLQLLTCPLHYTNRLSDVAQITFAVVWFHSRWFTVDEIWDFIERSDGRLLALVCGIIVLAAQC